MDFIDIIIPTYNSEKYITETIESVKKQTIKNWKIIIIDDGSTDNTIEKINNSIVEIKDKVEVIKLKKNKGVANARNVGIQKSTNRYIAFLDSDDIWEKEKLEKQINYMKRNNYYFTYTNYTYLKNNRQKKIKQIPSSLTYTQALKNTIILTSTVIIDTKKISREKIIMPNIKSEDTATWWKILKEGNIAYGYKENLTIYRVRKSGLSYNKIVNLKRTWNLYRKSEGLGITKSLYFFIHYIYNAIKKRVI